MMARLSDTPPQPDSYAPGDTVWAVPRESPTTDQSAYLARVLAQLTGDAYVGYVVEFDDEQMPAHWRRRRTYAYEELELLPE
ncbi:hypothetical protein ACIBG8_54535 [Nonomuraea sp. NPDC050556]|uniref:hypothetical protein n=1 Tax=Nonomuraea sp. NPDC050556 TaxID=3364369 RepID=UPI0037AACB6C